MTDSQGLATPPLAARGEHLRSHHGEEVTDPYEWLRDKDDPAVMEHLRAENAYAEAATAHLGNLRSTIFEEIKSHVQETDLSVPVRQGSWWYYTRTQEGEQYPVYARISTAHSPRRPELRAGTIPSGEEVMLDANHAAAGSDFFALGAFDVSPSGRLLAYAVDTTGDERFDLHIKDLKTGVTREGVVAGIGYGVAWSSEDDYLFYTRVDDAWRPHEVWRHRVGDQRSGDTLVHSEPDDRYWMGLGTSRDDRYIVIGLGSKNTSEFWILPAHTPTEQFRLVAGREEGVEYDVEPAGDRLWIVHNRTCADFELACAPVASSTPDHWRTVLAGQPGVRMSGVDAFETYLALSVRREGLAQVEVLPLQGDGEIDDAGRFVVPVDEPIYTVELGHNPDFGSRSVLVQIESMVTPKSVYDLDIATGHLSLVKRTPVPGGYDAGDYTQRRLWARADDGTQIPISLVAHRDVEPDGTAPGVLYGYGAYEICIDPYFSAARLSYLDRGVVYAIAHVRGGGELGRSWYEQGRMEHKATTFSDFIACADHVAASGWVAPDRLAGVGGSAGGLLIGAAINLAPDRFRVVHAAVPFVDALTTILNPDLPLTVGEWEEWGNPLHDPEVYARMRQYTPYENVTAATYPAILATTGLNDTRVYYVEPAKWVARLRELALNDAQERPIVLKTEMVAGHGGKTGRYDAWHEAAFEMAFIIDQLGTDRMRDPKQS